MAANLKHRLLQDIAELQAKPYPRITVHIQDDNLEKACLVLEPEGYGSMHMTIRFPNDYPLEPPRIEMNSNIEHPNVIGGYICASILNTREGYTPAYTLKGIAIQMLSFFNSEKIEQEGGGYSVRLDEFRAIQSNIHETYLCRKCSYGTPRYGAEASPRTPPPPAHMPSTPGQVPKDWPSPHEATQLVAPLSKRRKSKGNSFSSVQSSPSSKLKVVSIEDPDSSENAVPAKKPKCIQEMKLPSEVLLLIFEELETEDLMAFAQAWRRVGQVITLYDVIRSRELQCFCFKKDYKSAYLGIGINVEGKCIQSEFDLLSYEGFHEHYIRRSVLGLPFQHWLPLPISAGHWKKARKDINDSLTNLSNAANLGNIYPVKVIYHFMNDVVVKLQTEADSGTRRSSHYPYREEAKSSLTHASEKAIESYFHLFHLLLCLAAEDPTIVKDADEAITSFAQGATSKDACPNLGHLLVASLISSVEMSRPIMHAIVKESITRNVVWMLGQHPELAYIEPSAKSLYRLKATFEASMTSYRLLMFLNLFRRTAVGSPRLPLNQLRDQAFDRHGAPPRGSARGLADSIKRIHKIEFFKNFLIEMGLGVPNPEFFTDFLRQCIKDSEAKGYHRSALSQGQALWLRLEKEPSVERAECVSPQQVLSRMPSFFPARGNTRGGRGGRGGSRGDRESVGRGGRGGRWR